MRNAGTRLMLAVVAAVVASGCASTPDQPRSPRQFTEGPFTLIEEVQPIRSASPASIDAAVTRYASVLAGMDLGSAEAAALAGHLREGLREAGSEAGIQPALAAMRDIRARLDTLEAANRITPAIAALAAEVPWAIICQELGCPVKRSIGGRSCMLVANAWWGSWYCIYLCV